MKVTYIRPKQETGLVVVIGMQVIPYQRLALQNLRQDHVTELHILFTARQLSDGIYELLQVRVLSFFKPRLSHYPNANGQNTNYHNISIGSVGILINLLVF